MAHVSFIESPGGHPTSPTPATGEIQNPPPWPPAPVALSACAAHGEWIAAQVEHGRNAGLVQVKGAYYSALPAPLHREVTVRIYAEEIEILDTTGGVLRRHAKASRKGVMTQ